MQQLAELVGKNLYQLSNLNGLNYAQYEQLVLPCVTEQIVQCGDRLAQQYLMEVRLPLLLCLDPLFMQLVQCGDRLARQYLMEVRLPLFGSTACVWFDCVCIS